MSIKTHIMSILMFFFSFSFKTKIFMLILLSTFTFWYSVKYILEKHNLKVLLVTKVGL